MSAFLLLAPASSLLPPAHAHRIEHDRDRAQRHADGRDPWRYESDRGERKRAEIVSGGPNEVLPRDAHRAPRGFDCARQRSQLLADEYDISGSQRKRSAATDRDGDVRRAEYRRVVDAITLHRQVRAVALQVLHGLELLRG